MSFTLTQVQLAHAALSERGSGGSHARVTDIPAKMLVHGMQSIDKDALDDGDVAILSGALSQPAAEAPAK